MIPTQTMHSEKRENPSQLPATCADLIPLNIEI